MATFRNLGTIHRYESKMVEGMVRRGYSRDFATRCYNQIKGFGSYGFPESHGPLGDGEGPRFCGAAFILSSPFAPSKDLPHR